MGLGAKQTSEYSLQKMSEINAHEFVLIETAKKQHKETGLGSHIIFCTNSDSNFPKQVPVDSKKMWSV